MILTVLAVLIAFYSNFVEATWENEAMVCAIVLISISTWIRRKQLF